MRERKLKKCKLAKGVRASRKDVKQTGVK